MPFGKRKVEPIEIAMSAGDFLRITRLPREVGRWMARLDVGGGGAAEARENAAIESFLEVAERKFLNLPTLVTLIRACKTTKNPPAPLPEAALFTLCDEAVTAMTAHALPHEVNAYKLLLIEMAEAVARSAHDRTSTWFLIQPLVSRVEKEGINRLIDALQAGTMVEKWMVGMEATGPGVRAFTSPLTRTHS